MVYKHVIGLKTDSSQSNLGGNTDSNHLIPGEEWAFFIRLAPPSSCLVLFPAVFRGFLSSFPRHRMPAFLCSVPLPVSRPLFLFCRMLSGLFVCPFPGIECRLSPSFIPPFDVIRLYRVTGCHPVTLSPPTLYFILFVKKNTQTLAYVQFL